jgi:tetratricopeptide (TPR) repeat protein
VTGATMNFFDTEQFKDPQALAWYLSNHSQQDVATDLQQSRCDPNDVLSIGDSVYFMLKNRVIARLFYETGLRTLDAHPDLLAKDINPLLSRRNLCAIFVEDESFDDALKLLSSSPDILQLDPNLGAILAYKLYEQGAYQQALPVLDRVLQLPQSELSEKVQVPLNSLHALHSAILAKASVRRLRDLKWFWNPDVEPVPDGILSMGYDALTKKGLPTHVLDRARSAVIMQVSNDRKMWFIFIYDRDDPTPIMQREKSELCFVSFYHRDGTVHLSDVSY